MPSRLRLLFPLLFVLVLSACGGQGEEGERASSTTDANALLRSTFQNLDQMKSATVDLTLRVTPKSGGGDAVSARVHGPFASQGKGKLAKFALQADLESGAERFSAGATYTGEKGYITLMGTPYEVSGLVLKQFVAGYEQATRSSKQRTVSPGLLGIDFSKWLKSARNEGEAKVAGTDAIKITGEADVARVIADLDKIAAKAATLPGTAGKVPQRLTPQQKQAAADAIKALNLTVFTGAEDRFLRRLTVSADLRDPESKVDANVLFDVTFTRVGEEQSFPAPSGARPFSELLKAVDAAGLGDLRGLGSDKAAPGASSSPNNVDKYAACIEQAGSDRAKARKCAELLSG
jgi:hypothetical protein